MNYYVKDICDTLIDNLQDNEEARKYLTYSSYIRDFRTIGLIVPRATGKTTYIKELHQRKSSLILCKYANKIYYSQYVISNIGFYLNSLRGQNTNGLKYQCLIIDEFVYFENKVQQENLDLLLNYFKLMNMVTDDFFVLKLGT